MAFSADNTCSLIRENGCLRLQHAYKLGDTYYDVLLKDRVVDLTRGEWIEPDLKQRIQGHWKCHLERLNIQSYNKIEMTAEKLTVDGRESDSDTIHLDVEKYRADVGESQGFVDHYRTKFTARDAMLNFEERAIRFHGVYFPPPPRPPLPPMISIPSDEDLDLSTPRVRSVPPSPMHTGLFSPKARTAPPSPEGDATDLSTPKVRSAPPSPMFTNLSTPKMRATVPAQYERDFRQETRLVELARARALYIKAALLRAGAGL